MIIFKIIFVIAAILLSLWSVRKLRKSPKFDKFCKDLEEDKVGNFSSQEVMNDIGEAKDGLQKRVKDNTKEEKALQKDNKQINTFLNNDNRGTSKGGKPMK